MYTKTFAAALIALLLTGNNAHALFGDDACRNVILSVDNNFGQIFEYGDSSFGLNRKADGSMKIFEI
jgi:hypothetical protein